MQAANLEAMRQEQTRRQAAEAVSLKTTIAPLLHVKHQSTFQTVQENS